MPSGRIAEIGTAYGEGAKAIVKALGPEAMFVTVEPDPGRYAHASAVLAGSRAEVLNASWEDVLPGRGPLTSYSLTAVRGRKRSTSQSSCSLPAACWSKTTSLSRVIVGDPVREAFLSDSRLIGMELSVSPVMNVIVTTRRN